MVLTRERGRRTVNQMLPHVIAVIVLHMVAVFVMIWTVSLIILDFWHQIKEQHPQQIFGGKRKPISPNEISNKIWHPQVEISPERKASQKTGKQVRCLVEAKDDVVIEMNSSVN
ncbi:uncharacterized protein LOC135215001 [Macrobrachium nipponense]|uniref:uncharacterized protein LOC135215001 n=1 Tax=Macrobrachium nipponense TaxID=159736 RepID=UPI0030C7BCEC